MNSENTNAHVDTCQLCTELLENNHTILKNIGYKYSSRIIYESEYSVIIPTIGCFIQNYLLIIPKIHVRALRDLNEDYYEDINNIVSSLENYFPKCIFFEHGGVNEIKSGGASIDHAHLHCIPLDIDIVGCLHNLSFKPLQSLFDVNSIQGEYLFVRQQRENYFTNNYNPKSQLLRSFVAKQIGIEDKYNWHKNPFTSNMEDTFRDLKKNIKSCMKQTNEHEELALIIEDIKEFQLNKNKHTIEFLQKIEKILKLTKDTYNKSAHKYNSIHLDLSETEKELWSKLEHHILELKKIKSTKGLKLLEVGAGTGKDLVYAQNNFNYDLYGIDNCEEFIEIIYRKIETKKLEIPFDRIYNLDMRDLSVFKDNSFDVVRHNATLLHLPVIGKGVMVDKAISESFRILKDDGILFIMAKEGESVGIINTKKGIGNRFFQFFSVELLQELLERNGLEIIEIFKQVGDYNNIWINCYCKKKNYE